MPSGYIEALSALMCSVFSIEAVNHVGLAKQRQHLVYCWNLKTEIAYNLGDARKNRSGSEAWLWKSRAGFCVSAGSSEVKDVAVCGVNYRVWMSALDFFLVGGEVSIFKSKYWHFLYFLNISHLIHANTGIWVCRGRPGLLFVFNKFLFQYKVLLTY